MPALQCPECGHREDLDAIGDVATFSCGGCGRALKVPAQFRAAEPDAAVPAPLAAAPVGSLDRTDQLPAAAPIAAASRYPPLGEAIDPGDPVDDAADERRDWREEFPLDTAASRAAAAGEQIKPLAWWARGLIWFVALPLSLAVVFRAAARFGWLSKDDLIHTLTEVGWDRFVPVARLLPFAALLTALIVQGSILGIDAIRASRARSRRAARAQRERPTAS